jgi:ubiquinone/menaquinone biosynthesis C-methylase UbiE
MYDTMTGRFADPRNVSTHFHLRAGDRVADFGAGSGHFMRPLSEAVGREGMVYLCEIQKPLVEALGIQARDAHLSNIKILWGDVEEVGGTKIQDGALDAGVMSNVLFQLTDKQSAFKEVARTLRKGGKLFVIDWTSSFAGIGPLPELVVAESEARTFAESAGLVFERSFPAGEHHYGIAFRKP